jgi:two-component system, chemotaxis family, sensor kinase CheA
MDLKFDIDQDEMPIFMAETDEQLQVLDEGLIRLEQNGDDNELVQALFRAAHTLKGTSGMIGHKRMVTLTHALENALDGVRKQQFVVTTHFVDLCLEAVDALRLLREEVMTKTSSSVEVDELASRFSGVSLGGSVSMGKRETSRPAQKVEVVEAPAPAATAEGVEINGIPVFSVSVKISENSIASAARAFQVVLALQSMGNILFMDPSQEEIDTARPVFVFKAIVQSENALNEILHSVNIISELDSVAVVPSGRKELEAIGQNPTPSMMADQPTSLSHDKNRPAEEHLTQNEAKHDLPARQAAGDAGQSAQKPTQAEKTVRTSVERLDNLMNLVGELITDRNRLYQIRGHFETRFRGDEKIDSLSETIAHIGRITDQLQKEVMSIRMNPVANVFHKFPRMVRDLALKFNKKVELAIEGEDTELDRSVIEEITDPLIHLIRNSLDHGVEDPAIRRQNGKPETARVLLAARHEQGRIVLTVEDDGAGINVDRVKASAVSKGIISEAEAAIMNQEDAINLIFASGLSTAKALSDISGRGVGLDIVRNNIQRLNGMITIETWPGKGTRFQITLPLTLAIVPTLLVRVGPCILAIPLVTVLETLRVKDQDIKTVSGYPVIVLRERVLPLMNLAEVFKVSSASQGIYHHIVVVGTGKTQMGLIVDTLLGQEEVVVKSLGALVGEVYGIASAAILGDGQVILILDVQDLSRHTNTFQQRKG